MNGDKPELLDTGKGYTVKYKGKHLYSAFHPAETVQRKISKFDIGEKTLVFIPSIGIGYGIEDLLGKLSADSHILCMEADPVLYEFAHSQKVNPIPSSSRFTCIQASHPNEPLEALRRLGTWRFRRISVITLSAGYGFSPALYDETARFLEAEIQTFWKNKMTLVRLAPLWIKNIFFNFPSMPHAAGFHNLSTDMPVIVAGAGPSLEESIECIKRTRKSTILLAVDTAFPILMKQSIRPDLIFMLESQIANIHDFISCRDRSIPVLCDITASPQVLHTIGNPICFFSSEFHSIRLLERMSRAGLLPEKIPALGSVGIAAVYGALRITSGKVFVTGLDFSYSGGKTHARGSPFQEIADLLCSRLTPTSHTIYASIKNRPVILLKDKNGEYTESDLILLSYAELMDIAVGRDKARVEDIGRCGIDLSLQRIGDGEEFDSLVTMHVKHNSGRKKETNFRLPDSGEISSFIRNEIDLLEKASACVKRLLDENDTEHNEIDDESMEALRDIDYTFLHFPEPNPDPVLDKSYLVRLLVSIMHYMEIEKRALALAS